MFDGGLMLVEILFNSQVCACCSNYHPITRTFALRTQKVYLGCGSNSWIQSMLAVAKRPLSTKPPLSLRRTDPTFHNYLLPKEIL